MDFSSLLPTSLGLGGEFQTRVGGAIERATSENLVSPDWAANMQICDEVCTRSVPGDIDAFMSDYRSRLYAQSFT